MHTCINSIIDKFIGTPCSPHTRHVLHNYTYWLIQVQQGEASV